MAETVFIDLMREDSARGREYRLAMKTMWFDWVALGRLKKLPTLNRLRVDL